MLTLNLAALVAVGVLLLLLALALVVGADPTDAVDYGARYWGKTV